MSSRPPAAPRPWLFRVDEDAHGPRQLTVTAYDGSVIEHRTRGGHTPETFAQVIANVEHYVNVVNAMPDFKVPEQGRLFDV